MVNSYLDLARALIDAAQMDTPQDGVPALLGFSPGSYAIRVNGKPNWAWVRLQDPASRTASQALNLAQVPLKPDLPVLVAMRSGVLSVVGYDPASIDAYFGTSAIDAVAAEGDTTLTSARAIQPGLVHAYDGGAGYGLIVQVEAFFYYPVRSRLAYFPGGFLDLTACVPGTAGQHCWAVVTLSPLTNTLAAIAGPSQILTASLARDDIAAIAVGSAIPLVAVRLVYGQTAIAQESAFTDTRPWWTIPVEPLVLNAPTILTLSAGVAAVTQTAHLIAAESGTADDLDTLTAAVDYALVLLKAASGSTITVRHGTGNIALNSAADFELSGTKTLLLWYDGTTWSDLGTGGSTAASTANWIVDSDRLIPAGKDAFIPGPVQINSGATLRIEGDLYIV